MAYSSWTQNMNSSRFQRQQCYLCDCPRAPWAILNDFSEPICRGCCNYEGPDRIEAVIDYVRSLRKGWDHQVRSLKNQNLNSTGTSIGSSPSPGGHSNGSMDAVTSMSSTPYSFSPYHNLIPHHSEHMRFMHAVKSEQNSHSDVPPDNFPSKSSFVVPSEPGGQSVVVNPRSVDEVAHAEEHRRFMASVVAGKDGPPPRMPIIRRPPEYSEYPEIVRDTLEVLNSCVPFDVRFKKDHNHVGRVFLFEAAPRSGATAPSDFELKIHIEYPRGSENFCQSASSVAKQMYHDSMKELGRGLSSGFKYLEYEVQGNPTEWRLLGDLLPENIRVFKEPISRSFLPQRVTDHPTFHPMLGPPVFSQNKYQRTKRKAEDMDPPGVPSRAPRRTYKEREDEQIQRHLWMQSQVDALRLSMAHLTGPPETAMHLNSVRSSAMLDRHSAPLPHAPLTPGSQPPTPHQPSPKGAPWGVPSSMAALISAASDATNPNSIKESRKTSLSDMKSKSPPTLDKDSNIDGKEDCSVSIKTEDASTERRDSTSDSHTKKIGPKGSSQLKCSICDDWLEDTHFVQCPSVTSHKFCFPCSKDSIKKQGFGNDVFCPSGKRCPLIGSNLPWAFMQSEIQTILATKGRPKQSKDEGGKEEDTK